MGDDTAFPLDLPEIPVVNTVAPQSVFSDLKKKYKNQSLAEWVKINYVEDLLPYAFVGFFWIFF